MAETLDPRGWLRAHMNMSRRRCPAAAHGDHWLPHPGCGLTVEGLDSFSSISESVSRSVGQSRGKDDDDKARGRDWRLSVMQREKES